MHCRAVQHRLVAWQDGELSPGELVRVSEHLGHCARCRDIEARLRLPEMTEAIAVPAAVGARLAAATRIDLLLDEAAREDRRSPYPTPPLWRRWLVDAVEVPGWSVLAAAALFTLTVGWAVQMTLEASDAQAEVASAIAARAIPNTGAPETPATDLPADQYQPASYQPGEEHGYR